MMFFCQRDFVLHKNPVLGIKFIGKVNVSRLLTLDFYYATLLQVTFMNNDSDKTPTNTEEELPEKELSEMDVKKIMIFRQIGAKIAYYRTLRQGR